ncbi:hypothetical protein PR048_033183 [Dryococelus australis]|uniref:Uncharacterized protein n=1 Tax=Dryococelus australis TaxID=614101 RepID=A0ABQ9G2W5_9NEOP|nr:hypothetical protein PR048_033183 [Dryococelus australis]
MGDCFPIRPQVPFLVRLTPSLMTYLLMPGHIAPCGATVAEGLDRSPPTKANWGSTPDWVTGLSQVGIICRTMPLVGGFSRGSPFPPLHSGAAPYSLQSLSSALKTSLLRPGSNMHGLPPESLNSLNLTLLGRHTLTSFKDKLDVSHLYPYRCRDTAFYWSLLSLNAILLVKTTSVCPYWPDANQWSAAFTREYAYVDALGRLDVYFTFPAPLHSIIWGVMGITGLLLRCSFQPLSTLWKLGSACHATLGVPVLESRTSRGPRWCSGQTTHLPFRRTRFYSRRGRFRESCRTMPLVGGAFFGDIPFPSPLHSGSPPYSPHFTLIGSRENLTTTLHGRSASLDIEDLIVDGGEVSGIVRHDIPTCGNPVVTRPGIEPRYALAGGEQSSRSATAAPLKKIGEQARQWRHVLSVQNKRWARVQPQVIAATPNSHTSAARNLYRTVDTCVFQKKLHKCDTRVFQKKLHKCDTQPDQNKGAGETGDPRENPPTSSIVRHDCQMRKFADAGNQTRFALVGDIPISTAHWLYAVTVEGDDWASVLQEVSNTMWTNGEFSLELHGGYWLLLRAQRMYSSEQEPAYLATLHYTPLAIFGGNYLNGYRNTAECPVSSPGTILQKGRRKKISVLIKHIYSEVTFAIGSQFIRHALDVSEPIAELQRYTLRIPYCQSSRYRKKKSHLFIGVTLAERLARSPPTKANRAQSPAGSPDFRKWESCRMMPLIGGGGGGSRGSTVSPAFSFRRCSMLTSMTLIGSQDLDVKSRPNLFTHFCGYC